MKDTDMFKIIFYGVVSFLSGYLFCDTLSQPTQILPPVESVEQVQSGIPQNEETETILKAAARNDCKGDDLLILFAIRRQENGGTGKEFGIMDARAWGTTLDIQAGWAAATVVKNRARWIKAGTPGDFITFLGNRYCPVNCENDNGTNQYWVGNVKQFYSEMKGTLK